MAKLQKISVPEVPEDKDSLKNYELGRLIKLNQGITTLLKYLLYSDIDLSDQDKDNISIVLTLQSDAQNEIRLRIPGVNDNDGYIHW